MKHELLTRTKAAAGLLLCWCRRGVSRTGATTRQRNKDGLRFSPTKNPKQVVNIPPLLSGGEIMMLLEPLLFLSSSEDYRSFQQQDHHHHQRQDLGGHCRQIHDQVHNNGRAAPNSSMTPLLLPSRSWFPLSRSSAPAAMIATSILPS